MRHGGLGSMKDWTKLDRVLVAAAVILVVVFFGVIAVGAHSASPTERASNHYGRTHAEKGRAAYQRRVRRVWRAEVRKYGVGLLDARMACESGDVGGYALDTTGNGYWFAFQFNVGAWTGAGGRFRGGRPVGVWTTHPGKLEQRYRAVRWDRIHGGSGSGDAWPNCP